MMIDEFAKMAKLETIGQDDYDIIEIVYMFHPSIKEKQDIVYLFNNYGMTLIKDLYPRSEQLRLLEKEISEKKSEIEKLREKVNILL